jgi:hypothetical protein
MRMCASSITLLTTVTVILSATSAMTAQSQKRLVEKYTVIPVVLDDPLSSRTAHIGQKFETHCTTSSSGFPKNTTFVGVITQAQSSQGGQPGLLAAKFVEAVLPAGQHIAIEAVPSTAEGVKLPAKQGSQARKGRTGTGALSGAALGGLIGRDLKGALIGGAVGAGLGAAATGKTTDVEIKAGASGYIMLTQSVWLPMGP